MAPPVYLILGATGGIGLALARRLARNGARLVLAGRDAAKLDALARELYTESHTVEALDPDSVTEAARLVAGAHGRVDGIAACTGTLWPRPGPGPQVENRADADELRNRCSRFSG